MEPLSQNIAYGCAVCNKMYLSKAMAEICCKKYYCEDCGVETKTYHLVCESCHEKRKYNRAKKYTLEEYDKLYPNHFLVDGDTFYEIDDLRDYEKEEDEEYPAYFYGTTKVDVGLSYDYPVSVIEDARCEDLDFDEDAYKEFAEFVKQWNEKHGKYYFTINDRVVVTVSKEEWEEMMQ